MISDRDLYVNRIFLNAALPLLKVIAENVEKLGKGFKGKNGLIQVSAVSDTGKVGTRFLVQDGNITVLRGTQNDPDLELEFASIPALNNFFKGKVMPLPKIRHMFSRMDLFLPFLKTLLYMSGALGATTPPEKEEDKVLLVKMYFYMLAAGISQLNKAGHPAVSKWAAKSPDRVYAFRVEGMPELASYIRVKAGNTKSCRGLYTRSKPFFTMCFDSPDSALGILLQTDDIVQSTIAGKLMMQGAPEFGAAIGDFMMEVGALAK